MSPYIHLLLILLIICPSFYAQTTVINDTWSDDFLYDHSSGIEGWHITNDGDMRVEQRPGDNNKIYHGDYTNDNPSPITYMIRYFQCQQASHLYISYRFAYCGATDAFAQNSTDTVTLKYNDEQIADYDDLDRNTSHSHLLNDTKLPCPSGAESAHQTYRYKDKNVYIDNVSANTMFQIQFIFEITDVTEFVLITDIQVKCMQHPPTETLTPSKIPTTAAPSTSNPSTAIPSTAVPTTDRPTTYSPTTIQPTTSSPTDPSINPTNIPSETPAIIPSKTPTVMQTTNVPTKTHSDGEMFTTTNDIDSGGTDKPENAKKLDMQMILIIILVGIILLCCCIVCYLMYKKRKQMNKKQRHPDSYITNDEDDGSRDSDLWHNGQNEEQEGGTKGATQLDDNKNVYNNDMYDIFDKPIDDRYITPSTPHTKGNVDQNKGKHSIDNTSFIEGDMIIDGDSDEEMMDEYTPRDNNNDGDINNIERQRSDIPLNEKQQIVDNMMVTPGCNSSEEDVSLQPIHHHDDDEGNDKNIIINHQTPGQN